MVVGYELTKRKITLRWKDLFESSWNSNRSRYYSFMSPVTFSQGGNLVLRIVKTILMVVKRGRWSMESILCIDNSSKKKKVTVQFEKKNCFI